MRRTQGVAAPAALLAAALMLSGCAGVDLFAHVLKGQRESSEARDPSERPPPPALTAAPTYKVGKPYKIKGVWYYPQEDFDYDETGIASWYGPGFHGKMTANGEVFDQNTVSAAHKTLQMPCLVRVTNLENGRSMVVRVNDRGPYANGRIIDMSRKAAQLLGFEGKGTAKVRVQILPEESRILAGKARIDPSEPKVAAAPRESVKAESLGPPQTARALPSASQPAPPIARPAPTLTETVGVISDGAASDGSIFVQVGSFSRHDNALRLSARLSGIGTPNIQQASVKGQSVFRVRFGPLSSVDEADRLLDAVIAAGQQDARVVVD